MLNNVQLQLSTYVYPGTQEVIRQHNVKINFPKELLTKIFENVDSYKTLRAIQLVCKKWRAIVIDPKTYARIESAILRRFFPQFISFDEDLPRFDNFCSCDLITKSELEKERERNQSIRKLLDEIGVLKNRIDPQKVKAASERIIRMLICSYTWDNSGSKKSQQQT